MVKPMWTPAQVAARLNISLSQVYRLADNEIACVRLPGGGKRKRLAIRFEVEAVEKWIASHTQTPTPPTDGGAK